MKLNEKLNLVVPVYEDDGETIRAYVHSTPISREVFEENFLLISKTFTDIHARGLGEVAGPRIASMMMKAVAKSQRNEAQALSLMNEIRRLTNVLVRTDKGWEMIPFHEVVERKTISDDDLSEVENAIVFFIVISAMQRRQLLHEMLPGAASLWGAQTSLLGCTAFAASLPTSIAAVNIGEKPKQPESLVAF
jgi:hypothetical protein